MGKYDMLTEEEKDILRRIVEANGIKRASAKKFIKISSTDSFTDSRKRRDTILEPKSGLDDMI